MASQNDSLNWPFFDAPHRRLAAEARDWGQSNLANAAHPMDRAGVDARCRELVAALGRAGFLKQCLRAADGGASAEFDAPSKTGLRFAAKAS